MGVIGGSVFGAALTSLIVLIIVFLGKADDVRTIDLLSFSLVVVGIVVTALTVLGSFTLLNTWNDIDKRANAIVQRYADEKTAEIERNADERQKAIDEAANRAISLFKELQNKLMARNRNFTLQLLGLLGLYVLANLWVQRRARNRISNHI